jgi:hypothetical protein
MTSILKKAILRVCLAAIVVFSLSSCGGKVEEPEQQDPPPPVQQQPLRVTITATDCYTAILKGFSASNPRSWDQIESGVWVGKYQIIFIEAYNGTNEAAYISPDQTTLVAEVEEVEMSYSFSNNTWQIGRRLDFVKSMRPLEGVKLQPGTSTSGFILYPRDRYNEKAERLYFKLSGSETLEIPITQPCGFEVEYR